MKFKLKCKSCEATCWVNGNIEYDTNATNLNDNEIIEWEPESSCEHNYFEIIDQDEDEPFDWDLGS